MDKELLKTIIVQNQEYVLEVELNKRDINLEENGNYVFVGVRQAGKSYLLYQTMQELAKKQKVEDFVYINFDDERLCNMKATDLDLILQAYYEMYENKPILFFDEIQNIEGWEHFARRLANQKYRVFITGSNAKMLSKDIATTLGGRFLNRYVYPYSFAEFLSANGIKLKDNWLYSKDKHSIQRYFEEYFLYGGFPELLRFKDKRTWLNNIYSKIFFSDLIVRNRVKNEEALRMCVHKIAESIKQPLSYNRLANMLKTIGIKTSVSSIIDYVRYLQESCLLFSIENYASKFVDKQTIKKHYFVDNGLLNIFLTDEQTSLLENLCAIHLYKQYGEEVYFYNKSIEVDFYLPKQSTAIQVSYSLSDPQTQEREVQALVKLDKVYHIDKFLIITRNEAKTIALEDDREIQVIPIWQWLLTAENKKNA
jgi:uncharacterized protein